LNQDLLIILEEIKLLFHSEIHQKMGYPLSPYEICAILLYCGKSCNVQFSKDQIKFYYHKWIILDFCLNTGLAILSCHERREESKEYLYCGLNLVKMQNISKEIKEGYFISYVSTSNDWNVALIYRGDQGCILEFHPSMRRAGNIFSCEVEWISPYKNEHETLFTRTFIIKDWILERSANK